MRFVMDSNHRHAKFAARLLISSKNQKQVCEGLVEVGGFLPVESFSHLIEKVVHHRKSP